MRLTVEIFKQRLKENPDSFSLGCVVDTNILFAFSHAIDPFNEWVEEVVELLHANKIPIYSNQNIRSEFIELSRRVLIPECLVTMYHQIGDQIDGVLAHKLKSLDTTFTDAIREEKIYRFSDKQIKEWRHRLTEFPLGDSNGWALFCRDFFYPYIKHVWPRLTTLMQLNFIGAAEIEEGKLFDARPSWDGMIDIVGKTGIGSADAMISNLFLQSKLPLMITTDSDVRDALVNLAPNKAVLAP